VEPAKPSEGTEGSAAKTDSLNASTIHNAAGALELRFRPAFYGEVAKRLELIETDALFVVREVVASAQRQVTRGTLG
jgi:hypothetical protein